MRSNKDIRAYAIEKDVLIIQIAKEIGIQKSSISRKLAKELPQEEKNRIFKAIDNIAERKAAELQKAV
ncbi:MAG: hypothetical protein SO070_00720 [Ruminococcus bromii]|nr:hypothetical protein [Ruminococcus bromii]MDY4977380.1 hypothetical protein [Ruminococcus bromii]